MGRRRHHTGTPVSVKPRLGLYYYGARYYDPQLGRFVSPDTDVPESQGVQAWDRYAGMNNNPVKYTDPSGHMISECGPSDCTGVTEQELQENAQREAILLAESQQYQCAAGNTEYCSYAVAHPVETAVFVTGGLVTAGAAGPVIDAIGVAAGGITASATTAVEVSTGANVVYRLLENGTTRYVGITNDFFRRAGEHLERGWSITPIQGLENLSRIDARAVEQTLIEYYGLGNLYNSINSIAASNPIYQQAIQRGTEILQTIGFFGK